MLNALAGARLQELARTTFQLPEEFLVLGADTAPEALGWYGANISPIEADDAALDAFADRILAKRKGVGSVVGERAAVERLWMRMSDSWSIPREERWSQPLMEATGAPSAAPHPWLRPARAGEEALVFPAAVAMFREEVGFDPLGYDGGRAYRRRVDALIAQGRTYVVMAEGAVAFKADVGAVFGDVAQIHGVWVDPDLRGRGLARGAMASLVQQVRRNHAPRVSLYVNDYNAPARRAYDAAGFVTVGELATVLF